MTRNQTLLAELNKCLDNIELKIKEHNIKMYQDDFGVLRLCIQHSLKVSHRSSFIEKNDVVKAIMKIINKIDKEITTVEVEMHGVANYSGYESHRVDEVAFKQSIKDDLNGMLEMIIHARPELRDAELSGIIKMLG